MTAGTAPVLIGRDREVRALTELIGRSGKSGQALVVLGDPGIGKSALLGAAQDVARAAGFRVLSACGVESEAQLPFAGLHQILRPVLRSVAELPPLYATALRSAFGLAEGPTPKLFQIALAAVDLLAAAAVKQPVAVLVDDVQWLDQQSQEVDVHRPPGRVVPDGHRGGDADRPSRVLPGRRAVRARGRRCG
jgi:predicted ATPase